MSSSFCSVLQTVDADKVYILGGLVDESIQKVLKYNFTSWALKLIPRKVCSVIGVCAWPDNFSLYKVYNLKVFLWHKLHFHGD